MAHDQQRAGGRQRGGPLPRPASFRDGFVDAHPPTGRTAGS